MLLHDDTQWWYDITDQAGYAYSWTVANDLWTFENVSVIISPRPFAADPYSIYINGASEWNNTWEVYGAFIGNQYMSNGNFLPNDPGGYSIPLSAGDLIFYNWQYTGDQYGNGFFADHVAFLVASNGIDPNNGWQGPLIDQHTTDRQGAIWSLIPYNSQYATKAGWYDQMAGDSPGSSAAKRTALTQRLSNLVHTNASRAQKTPSGGSNLRPDASSTPRITTPSTRAGQLTYSGKLKVEARMPPTQVAAAQQGFQAAMIARQQMIAVPSTAPTTAAHRPAQGALQDMAATASNMMPGLFTGAELTHERAIVRNAQSWEAKSDIRALGGRASDFHYALVRQLSPTQVELRGTVRTWAQVAQIQASGKLVSATPSNTLDVDVVMVQTSSGWKVSSLDWTFAPGSQP
jgi:hypothetical protein